MQTAATTSSATLSGQVAIPLSVSGVTTAPGRIPTRTKHRRASGDGHRQHRARDQSTWKADQLEAYPAHRGNEQRPHNLHKLAQWGNRKPHRFVPDARVAGQGASRGALLITDQCRLPRAASNGGASAESHAKLPGTPLRGVPRGEQRYSRFPIRAVECAGGLRAQGPRNHHAARLDRYRLRTRLYRPPLRGCELRGPDSAVRARRRLAPLHLSALARDLLHLLDVLWLGGARIAHRLRLSDHLCRAHPVVG